MSDQLFIAIVVAGQLLYLGSWWYHLGELPARLIVRFTLVPAFAVPLIVVFGSQRLQWGFIAIGVGLIAWVNWPFGDEPTVEKYRDALTKPPRNTEQGGRG